MENMRLAYNASRKCCGVRIGEEIVTEDDLVAMSVVITQRCTPTMLARMISFMEDAPDDLNFKRSAFFYARFFVEHYKLRLSNVSDKAKWDNAISSLISDMQLHPVNWDNPVF